MLDNKKNPRKLVLIIIIVLVVLVVGINLVRAYIVNIAMEQGKNAYDQYDNDLAITNYNKAIKFCLWDKEKKADSFLWRGRSYYGKEEYDQALADFTKAIELQNDYYPYYTWRARTHHKMGNYKLAIADFSKSIELDEYNSWDRYLERANSYYMNEEYELEFADYDLAILELDRKINSDYISDEKINELKEKRKNVLIEKEKLKWYIKQRIEWYTEEIFKNPNNADLYFKRGYLYVYKSEYPTGSIRETIIEMYNLMENAWDNRAISDWKKALRINPNHVLAKDYLQRTQ